MMIRCTVQQRSKEQHWEHLLAFSPILAANRLTLNRENCVFSITQLNFISHLISTGSVAPLWDNVQVILDFPTPTDCKAFQRFLGMIKFYRCFLPGIAGTLQPLTAALADNPKVLLRCLPCPLNLQLLKAALVATVPLVHLLPGGVLSLVRDASEQSSSNRLVSTGSLLVSSAKNSQKRRYINFTFDRELQTASSGIKHFCSHPKGRPFRLWTDHKLLLSALTRVSPLSSGCRQRHLA
jgi:hypothetical protein